MVDQLVIEQLATDLLRAETDAAATRSALVEIIADLTVENIGLRLLVQRLNKGGRRERDALRSEIERYTAERVSD